MFLLFSELISGGLKVVKPAPVLATHKIRKAVSSRMRRRHVPCPYNGHILSAGQMKYIKKLNFKFLPITVSTLECDLMSLYTLWDELLQNQDTNASRLLLPGETFKTTTDRKNSSIIGSNEVHISS